MALTKKRVDYVSSVGGCSDHRRGESYLRCVAGTPFLSGILKIDSHWYVISQCCTLWPSCLLPMTGLSLCLPAK